MLIRITQYQQFLNLWRKSQTPDKANHFKAGLVAGLSAFLGVYFGLWGYIGSVALIFTSAVAWEYYQFRFEAGKVEAADAYTHMGAGLITWLFVAVVNTAFQGV